MNNLILQPILFMGTLCFAMMIWMYATRIPAAKLLEIEGLELQSLAHPAKIGGIFPSKVERVADNYNHLWEQPTLFYALIFVIWAQNHTDQLHLCCAWSYCVLRLLHSLVQSTLNYVWIRFALFILSWCFLAIMLFRECLFTLN